MAHRTRLAGFNLWLCALVLAGMHTAGHGADLHHRFAPPESWIESATPDYEAKAPAKGVSDGSWYLLFDRQIDVRPDADHFYQHVAIKLLSSSAVAENATIDLSVDPSYQTLDIHFLRIHRAGKSIDHRNTARITELAQETELSRQVYNGAYNINVLLSDVRVGDVLEYAYSIRSREELFPGHIWMRLQTGWSSSMHWQRVRIRAPKEKPMYVRRSDGRTLEPTRVDGRFQEYRVESQDLPAIPKEDDVPDWHFVRPYLEFGNLDDWSAVAGMMVRLYAPQMRGGPRLAEVAREIKARGGSPEEQALLALRYVQQEIRYTSISIGPGSHRPSDPETVLGRKFGDCKDKTVLLVALLAQLGIEAQPALVHTERGRVLPKMLPSPYVFNHVIVRVPIGRQVFWVDGTSSPRYSPFTEDDPADYENTLVVSRETTGLAAIARPAPAAQRKEVSHEFDLKAGIDKPATLTVTTRYLGTLADDTRAGLDSRTLEQRNEDYLSYTARYYPGAKSAGDITVEDDLEKNILVIRERYTLDPPFVESDGELELFLHADEIYSYLDALSFAARNAPLELSFPVSIRQQIVAHLPEPWPIEAEVVKVDNPAFRYRSDVDYAARTLEIVYEYEALADHVAPADLKKYLADRKKAYDDAGYRLSQRIGASASSEPLAIAPLPLFILLASLGLSIWAAIRWGYRQDPEPRPAPAGAPEGFAGWLIIPTIITIAGPFVSLYVIAAFAPFIGADLWHSLPATVDDAYRAWAQPVLLIIVALAGPLLVGHVLLAILYFRKRTSVPVAFIALLWFAYFYGEAVVWAVFGGGLDEETTLAENVAQSIRDGLSTLIWTAYMVKSDRVKATFRERFAKRAPQPEPASAPA